MYKVKIEMNITKEQLDKIIYMYITEKRAINEISKILQYNHKVITQLLIDNNVPIRGPKDCHKKSEFDTGYAIKLYTEGNKSIRAISKIVGVSYTIMRKFLISKNLVKRVEHKNEIITKEDIYKAAEMHKNNIAIVDIADALGYSSYTITYSLNKIGINPKNLVSDKKTKISNNFTFLDFTPEKCFVLGLIYGDGHVDKSDIKIYSNTKDIDNLNTINALFGNKLSIVKDKRSENAISIKISKKILCNELREKFGLVSNKSDKLIFPKIPEKMYTYFISGFLAADGSINVYTNEHSTLDFYIIMQSCSFDFIKSIHDIIHKNLNIKCTIQERNPVGISKKAQYIIKYSDTAGLKVCDYILANTTELTRCNRKYLNYMKYKIWYNEKAEQIKKLNDDGCSNKKIKEITHRHEGIISNTINGNNFNGRSM